MKCGLLLPSLACSPSRRRPRSGRGQARPMMWAVPTALRRCPRSDRGHQSHKAERDGVSLIYPVTADTGPPVRVDTLRPLGQSGRRVLTGPRSDTRQAGPQRRRSEGKAATTGTKPGRTRPLQPVFLLFCPINGPFSRHFPAPLAHARSDESFGGKRQNHHPLRSFGLRG